MEERNEIFDNYRAKHKRCRYCEFLRVRTPPTGDSFFVCEIKDIILGHDLGRVQGRLCRVYYPRVKEKNDIGNTNISRSNRNTNVSPAAKATT